jgi:lipopolysaccharide export LptBFGC system permease protein LptF
MKWANIFRYTARTLLLVIGIILFLFGLLSGAEMQDGVVNGLINNSPNALPGLGLLILTAVSWRYELIGGILLTLFGFFLIYFFSSNGNRFFLITFIATLIITILGLFLMASWIIRKKSNQFNEGNLG